MALDVWFKADVTRILAAAEQSGRELEQMKVGLADPAYLAAYFAGRRAALAIVASAFGLSLDPDPGLPHPAPMVYDLPPGAWHDRS